MQETSQPGWLALACQRPVVVRSLKVALVVGTLLGLINHGDAMLAGTMTARRWIQVGLTYLVPYLVATYGAVGALRSINRSMHSADRNHGYRAES